MSKFENNQRLSKPIGHERLQIGKKLRPKWAQKATNVTVPIDFFQFWPVSNLAARL